MAVSQQVGLCKSLAKAVLTVSPGLGRHRAREGGESGHEVSRKQVLSSPGVSRGHSRRHPANAMGERAHRARHCHHQTPVPQRLPPHHVTVTVLGKTHQHRDTVSLE